MACLETLTLCPWYKRKKDRPRCPGTASSLSDSWCCQESLLLLSTDLLARAGGTEAPSLPAHLSASSRNSTDICSFLPLRSASPSSFITACSPSLPPFTLPEYKLSSLFFQEGGLGPINLWTNVKESGGRGHLSSAAPQRANRARRVPPCSSGSAQGRAAAAANTISQAFLISGLASKGGSLSCQPVLTDRKHPMLGLLCLCHLCGRGSWTRKPSPTPPQSADGSSPL